MLAAVKEARSSADVVVLSCHWGLSPAAGGAAAVVGYETVLAHAAIDAGVDLVVGHHPHMLEAVEVYKGKCIFYSLGNFAFDFFAGREFGLERNSFGLIRAVVRDRSLREVTFLPMRIPNDTATPVMQDTKEGGDIVDRLLQLSAPYGTQFTIGPQGVTVETAVPAGVA